MTKQFMPAGTPPDAAAQARIDRFEHDRECAERARELADLVAGLEYALAAVVMAIPLTQIEVIEVEEDISAIREEIFLRFGGACTAIEAAIDYLKTLQRCGGAP
jgi:hypothetical protein